MPKYLILARQSIRREFNEVLLLRNALQLTSPNQDNEIKSPDDKKLPLEI